jgi:ATP-dependent Lhr-like helicase
MDEAVAVLLGNNIEDSSVEVIRSDIKKEIRITTLLPKDIFTFPWSGHIGIRMLDEAMDVLYRYNSALIFTNTRSQCEIWYQRILEADPNLSGKIAMHHGSIGKDIRAWVEEALYNGELKAVVCTSSLDLGVDFRPVEAIIQVGGPKGINRFIQRAGRSGHRPGMPARIYFLPTHAMELLEGSALREGINRGKLESRVPYIRSFDVLLQYLMTLACGGGFHEETVYNEVKTSFSYESISRNEFNWCIQFLQTGGKALAAYDEFKKTGKDRQGIIRVANKMTALRHLLGIGTIVGDQSLMIKYENGRKIGSIEEMFINRLTPGDVFWFAGRSLEITDIKGLDVFVRNAKSTKAIVPSWQGGRMPLSSQFSEMIREVIAQNKRGVINHPELKSLQPLLDLQKKLSSLPSKDQLLIEYLESTEGFHLLVYSFEGRLVHEGLGALLAWRIARHMPISFTIAMNDYGIELLSDQPFLLSIKELRKILSLKDLSQDLEQSISQVEMARKKFREIAFISGMIFKGYPGKMKKDRYLQTSTSLLFNVFHDYDPDNLLYLQTYDEVRTFQLEEGRLQEALERISKQEIILETPERATPFAIPILVDRLREKLSTEKLEKRIEKMKLVTND